MQKEFLQRSADFCAFANRIIKNFGSGFYDVPFVLYISSLNLQSFGVDKSPFSVFYFSTPFYAAKFAFPNYTYVGERVRQMMKEKRVRETKK